jgi:signal transduction histidine kinase
MQDDAWRITTLFGKPEPKLEEDVLETANLGTALKAGQPLLIREGCPAPYLASYASQIIIPLVAESCVLGTINFALTRPSAYSHDDMRIGYMLALQLSSAIRNAQVVEELKRTQAELNLHIEALDAYNHTIAHDLKAPLSNIILRAELTAHQFRNDLPADAIKRLIAIRDSGTYMAAMIDQLLWLARLRNPMEAATPVEIQRVIDAVLNRFDHLLSEREIAIEVAPNLPKALGHAQWIEEVFANLVSNAIKYMGSSNPAPCISIKAISQGDKVRCEVRDTGIGIKPEDQARLFEMFTRVHEIKTEGSGLGLSIVQRIVGKLGGEIGVESTYGQGSLFWFTLPAVPA